MQNKIFKAAVGLSKR
jgi:dihydropyrimidinase